MAISKQTQPGEFVFGPNLVNDEPRIIKYAFLNWYDTATPVKGFDCNIAPTVGADGEPLDRQPGDRPDFTSPARSIDLWPDAKSAQMAMDNGDYLANDDRGPLREYKIVYSNEAQNGGTVTTRVFSHINPEQFFDIAVNGTVEHMGGDLDGSHFYCPDCLNWHPTYRGVWQSHSQDDFRCLDCDHDARNGFDDNPNGEPGDVEHAEFVGDKSAGCCGSGCVTGVSAPPVPGAVPPEMDQTIRRLAEWVDAGGMLSGDQLSLLRRALEKPPTPQRWRAVLRQKNDVTTVEFDAPDEPGAGWYVSETFPHWDCESLERVAQ